MLEALLKQSTELEYRIALAHAYAAARRTADCRRLVEEFLGDHPASAAATAAAGILELGARRPAAALAHLQKAEELGLPTPGIAAEVGRAYLRLRRFADARRVFSRAIEMDGELAAAQDGLGMALLGEGDAVAAADACARAVALNPDDAMIHYGHGLALARLGKWPEARAAMQAAGMRDPQCVPALHKLAEICDRLGDVTAAREYDRAAHLAAAQRRLAEVQAGGMARPTP